MEIQYLCPNDHKLTLKNFHYLHNLSCEICKNSVENNSPHYACDSCQYYVHKDPCSKKILKKQIENHHFHPHRPLQFKKFDYSICHSCFKTFQNAFMYKCVECYFFMDEQCAQMSNSITTCLEGQHCIQHSTHPHLLLHVDTRAANPELTSQIRCYACETQHYKYHRGATTSAISTSQGGVYYGCSLCGYFLHKKCIDQLQQEIRSLNHRHHIPLYLHRERYGGCDNCGGSSIFFYVCLRCMYKICMKCNVGAIHYEDHEHPLFFIERKAMSTTDRLYRTFAQCNVENCFNVIVKSKSKEFEKTDSAVFSCLDCEFKLHLLCGPLPATINHVDHLHSLTLVDSCVEDNYEEYCCDVCETERDPQIRVYICGPCNYVAHVHCLLSEITNVFKGDLKDVKLKPLGEDFWNFSNEIDINARIEETEKPLTLNDLINKLDADDQHRLRCVFYRDKLNNGEEELSKRTSLLYLEDEKINDLIRYSTFTETEFMSFIFNEFFSTYRSRKLKIKSADLALRIVNFKGYDIPLNLASSLKNLLHKYGDSICTRSPECQVWKSITFFFVCKVVKQMHTTMVINISKDLLQDWYHYIRFAESWSEFEVDFLRESLKKITREFFYQQLSRLTDMHIPEILEIKIQEKIAEYKVGLEKCAKFRESSSKEGAIKKELEKAMKAKWKMAWQIGF